MPYFCYERTPLGKRMPVMYRDKPEAKKAEGVRSTIIADTITEVPAGISLAVAEVIYHTRKENQK